MEYSGVELKKSPAADLQSKRGLFFEIGLVVSLAVVILAFSWNQKDKPVQVFTMPVEIIETEMVEITMQEEEKEIIPEKLAPMKQTLTVVSDIINVVKDDQQVKTTFDFTQDFDDESVVVTSIISGKASKDYVHEEASDEGEPYIIAEEMAKFMGGDLTKFYNWVKSRVQYPVHAQEAGIQGKVVISFIVDKTGQVGHITILTSPDSSLSEEAIRVVKMSPRWEPAKNRGVPVRLKFTLPIDFRIQ